MRLAKGLKLALVSFNMLALTLSLALPAQADRWEKFPGRGSRADWEKSWNLVIKQAYPLTQQEKWKEAMPILDRAIKIYPGDSFYHFLMAMAHQKTGNAKAAIPEFEKAMQLDPNDDHCPYYLGLLYEEQNDLAKAKPLFRKATKISPANPEPWTELALVTQAVDGPKQAVEVYNEALKYCPKELMLWNNLGGTQLEFLKNYKEAERAFKEAIKIDGKAYSPKIGLAETYYKKGSYREALKALQECSRMPEAKDPERSKSLNAMIKDCKKKLAPKPKPKKKVQPKVPAPQAPSAGTTAPAPSPAPAAGAAN